jgi:hypothetical protein
MIMMSRPDTTSGFSDEAPTNSGIHNRRTQICEQPEFLAYAQYALLGRCARGNASYFGPPTAPHSTASASFASFNDAAGKGSPQRIKPAPPNCASSISILSPSVANA